MYKQPEIIKKEEPKFINESVSNILTQIDDYDKKMLGYLIELNNAYGRDIINLDKFENVINALQYINTENEYDYLNSLLHPEKCKGVKIPAPIPVPSCAFQLHNTITLSTNASGNLCFMFNPFFLYDSSISGQTVNYQTDESSDPGTGTINYCSSFFFNNSSNLDGISSNVSGWSVLNIGQGIPSVYNQYRLVSASLIVRYIGRMDITSGVIGGGIIYDEDVLPGLRVTSSTGPILNSHNSSLAKYSNFDLAMDSFYHQETNCINGLREIYFPLDNTYEEYIKMISNAQSIKNLNTIFTSSTGNPAGLYSSPLITDIGRNGFQQFVYVLGAPPSSSCFKVDIYCNYETLPNAEFLNYMPLSLTPKAITPDIKKETMSIVQKNPITDLKHEQKWYGKLGQSIFSGLKKIWKYGLPKKALNVLSPFILPYFKPALALTNMIAAGNNGNIDNSFKSQNPNVIDMINNSEKDDGNDDYLMNVD